MGEIHVNIDLMSNGIPEDTAPVNGASIPDVPPKQPTKIRLLTLESLDRRTAAYRDIMELRAGLVADQGGEDEMSVAKAELATTAALTRAMIKDTASRWLRGEPVDLAGTYVPLANLQRRQLS